MRFTSLATIALGAVSVSAQTSPLALLSYLEALLSPTCRTTLTTLLSPNSTLGTCLQVSNLVPILLNNSTSIVPEVDNYLKSICAAPACTTSTISNATSQVLSSCASDLGNFGISNSTVQLVMGAYTTAREVACLSTNSSTELIFSPNYSIPLNTSTIINGTNSTLPSNSTSTILCPTALLYEVQEFLGSPLTNNYIDSLILGANATAYRQIIQSVQNFTIIQELACNDCVTASIDVVLENYPTLATEKISLGNLTSYTNGTGITIPSNVTSFTLPQIYYGVCNTTIGSNVTLPKSINETAFNTTLPFHNSSSNSTTNSTSTNSTSSSLPSPFTPINITSRADIAAQAAKKRFARWD